MGSIYKKRPSGKFWTISWFDAGGRRHARVAGRDRRVAMRELARIESEVERQRSGQVLAAPAEPGEIERLRAENLELQRQVVALNVECGELTNRLRQLERQEQHA